MKFEIKDTKRKTLENKISIWFDIACIYLKYLIVFPERSDLREQLIVATKGFFVHLKNEAIILKRLDQASISYEDYIDILNELDELYDAEYEDCDQILADFETTLSLHDLERLVFRDSGSKFLDGNKMQEILEYIDGLENSKNMR